MNMVILGVLQWDWTTRVPNDETVVLALKDEKQSRSSFRRSMDQLQLHHSIARQKLLASVLVGGSAAAMIMIFDD